MAISTLPVQQQVLRLISQIQCEEIRRTRESREINRQSLSIPVIIRYLQGRLEVPAISRDLSSIGIGLISNESVEMGITCELELELENSQSCIESRCLWCKPFGQGFFLSGWRFEAVSS